MHSKLLLPIRTANIPLRHPHEDLSSESLAQHQILPVPDSE